MGVINIKKTNRVLSLTGENRYFTTAVRYSTIKTDELIDYVCENSGLAKAQMAASFYAILQQLEQFVMNGHSIELGNLGTLYLSVNAKAMEKEEDAGASAIERIVVKFRQSARLRKTLNKKISFSAVSSSESSGSSDSTASGSEAGA